MGFFGTLFGGEAEEEAANKNRAAAAAYDTRAMDFLKTGYDTGVTNLNKGIDAYQPLSELAAKYNKGGDLYLDALGVNGPEGNTRAVGAFRDEPGYAGAVNAGMDVMNRRRAGMGMSASGNADIDALTFGQNMQDQQYQRWLAQLQGAGQTGVGLAGNVAQGQAAGYGNLANLANLYSQNQTGVAGTNLNAVTSANTLEAQGKAAGAKNLLGAGMSLATLALGGGTAGFAGSPLAAFGKSAGGLFMGGGSPSGYG